MLVKFKNYWPVVTLLLIALLLCVRNYTPGTWLSGWDTLHPEFNFGLAFERYFTGVFRTEQGLGAVAAHSHMADLPRLIILYISHFILPLGFLRYFYVFLNMVIGTLGMYFFLNKHLLKQKTASFLGALFYLLNIGTMQIFNVPFEMFTTLFMTLPLLFYFATNYLGEPNRRGKNLLFFCILVLLNSPSAYASTLWYVFFAGFFIYFLAFSLVSRKEHRKSLRSFLILIIALITTNLFWLAPNLYFVLYHAKEVGQANINLLFSDQAFLKNKEFGTIGNLLLLKSFYFDWNIYQGNNVFTDLLLPYIAYLKNIFILILSYGLGLSFLTGVFLSAKKLKLKFAPLLLLFGFCLFFLINDNFPTTPIYNLFQNYFPFFKEAFRFPDDKILNLYVFLVSIFFGYFVLFAIEKLKKINFKLEPIFAVIFALLIIFYSFPSFAGNFINTAMRVQIPNQYFQLFDYLNQQPETLRVANLPINSPYGWVYYNWGYQGAGFLYFGIKQPLLDRDFDRWSPYNESYYREMSYAIYKGDGGLLQSVIKKYQIGFILIDKSVVNPQNPKSVLDFAGSEQLINRSGLVKQEKDFGDLKLFKLKNDSTIVTSVNTNVNVSPATNTTYEDFVYNQYGDYISSPSISGFNNLFFPFRDLIDNQSKLHNNILSINAENITLNPLKTVQNFQTGQLSSYFAVIPADLIVEKSARALNISLYPNVPVFDNLSSASPLTTSLNIGQQNNDLSLSVNQNELFNLGNLPDNTPLGIAKVTLRNDDNTLSIFGNNYFKPLDNVSTVINPFFSSCNGNEAPQATFTANTIQITGKGDICMLIPYGFFQTKIVEQNANLLTIFSFHFAGNAQINSCLFDQQTSTCVYYKNPIRTGNTVSFPYVLTLNKTSSMALKIIIQANSANKATYILTNLIASYSQSVSDISITKNLIDSVFLHNQTVSFNKIILPKNIIYKPGFTVTGVQKFNNDCLSPLANAKKEIVNINGANEIKYSALDGSFCDHFSYLNLPHNQAYLLVVNSKNEAGLPLTLCVKNYTSGRCDIYSNLSSFKALDKDVFLLPPMDSNGIGYDVNLSNLGIKGSPSVNYLSSVDFIPIPYNFLESIQTSLQTGKLKLKGKITKVTKYSSAFYVVTTDGNPTIVNLNLSYEKGFRAYYINCSSSISCIIKGSLAPFFTEEISEHVLVNNWSNGWLVNKGSQVVIIFLPQYLEYLGLIILFVSVLMVLITLLASKATQNRSFRLDRKAEL
jgi:hypothetical protein